MTGNPPSYQFSFNQVQDVNNSHHRARTYNRSLRRRMLYPIELSVNKFVTYSSLSGFEPETFYV